MADSIFMAALKKARGGAFFSAFRSLQAAFGAAQALDDSLSAATNVPVGGLVFVFTSMSGTPPANFQLCNGDPITDTRSSMVGLNTPDLITNSLFVRATAPGGDGAVQADLVGPHTHNVNAHTHGASGLSISPNPHQHQQTLAVGGSGATGNANTAAANNTNGGGAVQWTQTQSLSITGATAAGTSNTGSPVTGGGTETRPKNIAAVPYLRIF